MKKVLQFCLSFVFCTSYLFSQNDSLHTFENYDFHIETVLIDDRPIPPDFTKDNLYSVVELGKKQQLMFYSSNYNFDVSNIDFSPPKLMLRKRTDFANPDNILMLCGGLENGLYRNFDSGSIILGAGIDYLINDIILKDLLNFKIGTGKHN